MLDTETKRRIDTARDILVGKVPDPKSQVEQITIGLIYKFMDDMDADAEEMGGKRKFFAGEYARYGWSKLMQPGLGGHEMLSLYAEGIQKMPENPGIPPLFREIFKNAFLPYRDPETLKAFLKVIDEFQYDHSERLGDAFEYLLSVLGSQGDAGQFRTPRHIIDFIVDIVDPKKNDTVLDPACGTAGFLISSYKHILKANTDAKGHCKLTPEERAKLAKNFRGFDISPDMVRLSLVNLYLHGFTDPHIYEYDTLTSLDRWNEHADVILANPPFMSPKGGIKPHNRFGVQSKRSEVLFVDYIAEHLTPNGRAGVIVPEGIIFQSQNAYKQLRKLLVEDYLVAVVSLPAGVFNPYSGVKTSILILDKSLAKQANTIAFFKVENDGFNLGAQRRPIDKDDLPQVRAELHEYLRHLKAHESMDDFMPAQGLGVPKKKIVANGDYNLNGERYRDAGTASSQKWPMVALANVCETVLNGCWGDEVGQSEVECFALKVSDVKTGGLINYAGATPRSVKAIEYERNVLKNGDILVVKSSGSATRVVSGKCAQFRNPDGRKYLPVNFILTIRVDESRALPALIYYFLSSSYARQHVLGIVVGSTYPNLKRDEYLEFAIPLPPLDVQKEIVAEIEAYQKVIDGARVVIDNYRPHIAIDPDWPMVALSDVCASVTDGDHLPPPKAQSGVPFVTISNLEDGGRVDFSKTFFVPRKYYEGLAPTRRPARNDILYAVTGSYGIAVLVDFDTQFCFQRHIALLRPSNKVLPQYLLTSVRSPHVRQQADRLATGMAQKTVSLKALRGFTIPLPPLAAQRSIVAEIEAEQALVNANRELIARMEKKIQATLARVWGEDAPPEESDDREAA